MDPNMIHQVHQGVQVHESPETLTTLMRLMDARAIVRGAQQAHVVNIATREQRVQQRNNLQAELLQLQTQLEQRQKENADHLQQAQIHDEQLQVLGPQLANLGIALNDHAVDLDMATQEVQLRLPDLVNANLIFVATKVQMKIVVQDLVPLGFDGEVRIHNLITNLEAAEIRRLGGLANIIVQN